ncbi:unannotated protein [freshwater metagenome]|uniref:Unannotated protein n=1 Tax=freshwater metagenome TaxID=449393 RepID=A0A6J7FBW1_9ZZZZ|nr:zinc ABC transporter substrate-binding protein [Actinomycetota bacterium]
MSSRHRRYLRPVLALLAITTAASCAASSPAPNGAAGTDTAAAQAAAQAAARDRCLARAPIAAGQRLHIASTVAPITSIVANVAGDLADITGLVPEGTNSHTFEPPPSVAATLATTDIVFANGLKLEDPTSELAQANMPKGSALCELGTAVLPPSEYIYDFSFPQDAGKPNPHLWTNPPLAKQYAALVRDVLVSADPTNAATYQANATAFMGRIDALDTAMRAATATLDPAQRQLLTYHDAYAYFAVEYGWKVIGAIQPSSFDEPTAQDVAKLIVQIRSSGVRAIFGSEVFPSTVLKQIGRETGVQYVDVLRDDDLIGKPGDADHSYLGLMRFDYVTMIEALGGNAAALIALDVTDVAPDTSDYPQ